MPQYETAGSAMLAPILDQLPQAVVLLHPLPDESGTVSDFKVAYANSTAAAAFPAMQGGGDPVLLLHNLLFGEYSIAVFEESLAVLHAPQPGSLVTPLAMQLTEMHLKRCEGGVLLIINKPENITTTQQRANDDHVLRSIVNHSPNGIVFYEPIRSAQGAIIDFCVAQYNSRSIELMGITAEEREALSLRQILERQNAAAFFDQYVDVVEKNKAAQREQYMPQTNKWISNSAVRLGSGLLIMLADITELKQSQQTLQKEMQLSESILNASINGIFVLEAVRDAAGAVVDFLFIKINNKLSGVLGKKEEEIIGKSYLSLLPPSKENGLFELKKQILATGLPVQKEFRYKGAGIDGWFLISMAPLGTDVIVETFTDITESKKTNESLESAAQRFETVVNTSKAGMFTLHAVLDANEEITDFRFGIVNEAVAAYIGQTADVLKGALGSVYFPAYRTNGLFDIYKECYLTGKTFNFDFHYQDGYDVFFNIDVVKTGYEVLVTFTDHTALKRLQLELERNVDELKRLNTNLEDFTYAASHDLKEPVRKIRFFSERIMAMMGNRMTPEEKSIMSRIENATGRMSLLIDDLLEYSHVSRGADRFETVDLNKKILLVIDDLDITIQEKQATIEVGVLPVVKGHRRQLQQMFQNLLSNALKYSKPGDMPHIAISSRQVKGKETAAVRPDDADTDFYLLEFSDNGIGFDQEDANRIFNMFTRLHGKSEYAGTGVGLSIVKKVVENHNGYIWATGAPGAGAIFQLLLPVQQ
jgi:PAS domain S-box-containing protein